MTYPEQITNPPQTNAPDILNENLYALGASAIFAKRFIATSGLTWAYYGGLYNGNTIADGTVTLTDNATNYVVVLRSTGVVSVSTSTAHSTNSLYARLYKLTTVSGVVTVVVDERWEANGLMLAPTSSGGSILKARSAFCDSVYGNDSTGTLNDLSKPFLTIDAALDAAGNSNVGIFLSRGRFAPVTADQVVGTPSTVNPSSKLGSNISFIGSGAPNYDSDTAPTTLDANSGTVIDGVLTWHSTRHNIALENLGIDSGSAVCTARYSGSNSVEGVGTFNIGQVGSLAQCKGMRLRNVVVLLKSTATGHCVATENTIYPVLENVSAFGGTHCFAIKSIGGRYSNLAARGSSSTGFIVKESNTNNDTAPCHDNVMTNLLADGTSIALSLETASTRAMERLCIEGLVARNIGTYELRTLTTCSSGTPGLVQNVRVDNFITDNGAIRTSLASLDKNSIFVNSFALDGVITLTDAATIAVDARLGDCFRVTLGGNRTLGNPTNMIGGKVYNFRIIQDGTGSRTLAYGSKYKFAGGTAPVLSTAASSKDFMSCEYDATDDTLYCSMLKAFA